MSRSWPIARSLGCGLTIHSSRTRFVAWFKCVVVRFLPLTGWHVAGRLNSSVRPLDHEPRHLEALARASINAERAFEAAVSPHYASYPEIQRHTWAAAAILQCDILRYVVTFENSTTDGLVRLLWMGDIVSMLYEAKHWFYRTGVPNLLSIATSSGVDAAALHEELRSLKKLYPLKGVDAFAKFRNKVGHHYDQSFVAHLHEFSETDSRNFFEVLTNYAKYSGEWVVICKRVISQAAEPKA